MLSNVALVLAFLLLTAGVGMLTVAGGLITAGVLCLVASLAWSDSPR